MKTFVAGLGRWTAIGGMGFRVKLAVGEAGRTDGMQAATSMVCMALWLRQKEGEVPRRERAEIAMGVLLERGLWSDGGGRFRDKELVEGRAQDAGPDPEERQEKSGEQQDDTP